MVNPHDKYINDLSIRIHQQNTDVGWWDDPDRCLYTCLQLVSTEVAEATEGDRKDLMDDHLPEFKMEEVELADALIRVLDFGGKLSLIYSSDDAIVHSWCIATNEVGKQHLGINARIVALANVYMDFEHRRNETYKELLNHSYSDLIKSIIQVAKNRGYGLIEALEAKIEYNTTRADHKRENRELPGGKSY